MRAHVKTDRFSFSAKLSMPCRGILAVFLVLGLSACADRRGGKIPYNVENFGAPDAPVALDTSQTYHVGPGDDLTVLVYRKPELSGDVSVDMTGNFVMPLVGKVLAIGKTTDQLRVELTERLGSKYLQNPEINVSVKTASSQRVTIDGSIKQPGVYPVSPSTTLLQAIALAKGPDTDANARRIVIFRQIQGQRQAASFDLTAIRRGEKPDPAVFGNDIIVVDGNQIKKTLKDTISALPLYSMFTRF